MRTRRCTDALSLVSNTANMDSGGFSLVCKVVLLSHPATAAESLQSCPALCAPTPDGSRARDLPLISALELCILSEGVSFSASKARIMAPTHPLHLSPLSDLCTCFRLQTWSPQGAAACWMIEWRYHLITIFLHIHVTSSFSTHIPLSLHYFSVSLPAIPSSLPSLYPFLSSSYLFFYFCSSPPTPRATW